MTDDRAGRVESTFREYAWNYFELHAGQRLKTFQFFVTLSTALIAGFVVLLRYGYTYKWIAVLGFLLSFFSFVFSKLDRRTKILVENGEKALKYLDRQHDLPDIEGIPHPLRIFDRDDHFTSRANLLPLVTGHFSYSRSFRYVFVAVGLLGLCVGVACLILLPA
jgi:hypothetical protein